MRTTIYIKDENLEKLLLAAEELNVTKNEIISILLTYVSREANFDFKSFQTITYQKSDKRSKWKISHVRFEPMVYEKCQDLRRNFKFSVSWLIAFGIDHFLDKIIVQLSGLENVVEKVDNYHRNFIFLTRNFGSIKGFMTIWGVPDLKRLKEPIYPDK